MFGFSFAFPQMWRYHLGFWVLTIGWLRADFIPRGGLITKLPDCSLVHGWCELSSACSTTKGTCELQSDLERELICSYMTAVRKHMERGKESIRGCIYSAQCAACREKFKYLCWESFQSKSGLGNLYWRTIAPSIVFKHWCLSDVCLKNTQQSKECRLL